MRPLDMCRTATSAVRACPLLVPFRPSGRRLTYLVRPPRTPADGFCNFTSTTALLAFAKARLGTRWNLCASDKLCVLSYANIQVRRALPHSVCHSLTSCRLTVPCLARARTGQGVARQPLPQLVRPRPGREPSPQAVRHERASRRRARALPRCVRVLLRCQMPPRSEARGLTELVPRRTHAVCDDPVRKARSALNASNVGLFPAQRPVFKLAQAFQGVGLGESSASSAS